MVELANAIWLEIGFQLWLETDPPIGFLAVDELDQPAMERLEFLRFHRLPLPGIDEPARQALH